MCTHTSNTYVQTTWKVNFASDDPFKSYKIIFKHQNKGTYMVSYAHAEKTLNERRKTQSSAQYNHMQQKGQAVGTVVANKVCDSSNWREIGWVELGANRELNRLRGVWHCFEGAAF